MAPLPKETNVASAEECLSVCAADLKRAKDLLAKVGLGDPDVRAFLGHPPTPLSSNLVNDLEQIGLGKVGDKTAVRKIATDALLEIERLRNIIKRVELIPCSQCERVIVEEGSRGLDEEAVKLQGEQRSSVETASPQFPYQQNPQGIGQLDIPTAKTPVPLCAVCDHIEAIHHLGKSTHAFRPKTPAQKTS